MRDRPVNFDDVQLLPLVSSREGEECAELCHLCTRFDGIPQRGGTARLPGITCILDFAAPEAPSTV